MTNDHAQPVHRIGGTGDCRCGWERGDQAFAWSADIPALVFPAAPVLPSAAARHRT